MFLVKPGTGVLEQKSYLGLGKKKTLIFSGTA
jgi:hypothetical protein